MRHNLIIIPDTLARRVPNPVGHQDVWQNTADGYVAQFVKFDVVDGRLLPKGYHQFAMGPDYVITIEYQYKLPRHARLPGYEDLFAGNQPVKPKSEWEALARPVYPENGENSAPFFDDGDADEDIEMRVTWLMGFGVVVVTLAIIATILSI